MENNKPLITVITVCRNSAATIGRTIESVLAQSYNSIEYIIMDGASTDNTVSLIEGYKSRLIGRDISFKCVSEPDKGMYDAMNKGIALAGGDLIGILNSDDWYEPDALEHIYETYRSTPDADIIMGAIRIHNGDSVIIKHARDRRYRTSRDFNHPAMFVTKACYEETGEYGIDNVHDDYGWFLKAMKMGKKLAITDKILTNYPTGGAGSVKSFKNTCRRIGKKYDVYRQNGYSKLYYAECVVQEIGKYLLLKR